jgi:hypothetical protein
LRPAALPVGGVLAERDLAASPRKVQM